MHKLIVANYKMNGNISFYKSVQKTIKNLKVKDTEIVLCPPFVYVANLKIKNKNVSVGVQDISDAQNTKSTGQISSNMLAEFGVKYAIVGHSERRAIGETNEMVANKVLNATENNIVPIVCVGEENKKSSVDIVKEQVQTALSKIKSDNVIFAYEPVWAIGSGEIPNNKKIDKVISLIKDSAKESGFSNIKVLYGGSVNEQNYKDLLLTKADGFLLGGISLKLEKFISLVKGVDNE